MDAFEQEMRDHLAADYPTCTAADVVHCLQQSSWDLPAARAMLDSVGGFEQTMLTHLRAEYPTHTPKQLIDALEKCSWDLSASRRLLGSMSSDSLVGGALDHILEEQLRGCGLTTVKCSEEYPKHAVKDPQMCSLQILLILIRK